MMGNHTSTAATTPAALLKPDDVATVLAISPRKLWSLTAGGEIPCVRIGRAVRYDPRDLACYIETQKHRGMGR